MTREYWGPYVKDGDKFVLQTRDQIANRCASQLVSTHGDGSKALMATDAVASGVETPPEPTAQGRPDDHGSESRESDGKAALSGVPVSGAAESVAMCERKDGWRCYFYGGNHTCDLDKSAKCEHRAASVVIDQAETRETHHDR